jgi:hypothetical protein
MGTIDWKSKLTSRKFWSAIATFVTLVMLAMGRGQADATQVAEIIMAGAAVIAYIVGEGLVDSANAASNVTTTVTSTTSATNVNASGKSDEAVAKIANAIADASTATATAKPEASVATTDQSKEA